MLGLMVIGLPLIFWERERVVGAEEDFAGINSAYENDFFRVPKPCTFWKKRFRNLLQAPTGIELSQRTIVKKISCFGVVMKNKSFHELVDRVNIVG